MTRVSLSLVVIFSFASVALADDKPDLAVVHRIKAEAFRNGKVMDHLFAITDENGPRVTASPGYHSAADKAVQMLTSWGASAAHLESWGPFGKSWAVEKYELNLVTPVYARLGGVPKVWSGGTKGAVTAGLVSAPFFIDKEDRDDLFDLAKLTARIHAYAQTHKGKLKGRFVLLDPVRDLALPTESDSSRLDDKKLGEIMAPVDRLAPIPYELPLQRFPRDPKKRNALLAVLPRELLWDFVTRRRHVFNELWKFFAAEGVAGVLGTDDRGAGGLVFAESTGSWESSQPQAPPVIALNPEEYDRLLRLVDKSVPVKVQLELRVATSPKDEEGVNVIGEIPGTKKADEVVMMGAHLDSWQGSTGATDNGVGSAVMLEAFRILKALKLPMERTVRIALWSGEEQGLYGSRGYVKAHFADPMTMQLKPEHAKLAGYFNLDNGSGKIRGIYLQNNDMARPIFEAWLAPWKDEGAASITLRDTGGTDHLSFDAVGLSGFQFIQDPLDYGTRTHHSNLDDYEHAQPGDLMQASAIIATFVYLAANRPELLPRKPLPLAINSLTAPTAK